MTGHIFQPRYTPAFFRNQGWLFTKTKRRYNHIFPIRNFLAYFGVEPHIVWLLWNKLRFNLKPSAKPFYLLTTLLFLKTYATEHILAAITGRSEKTLRTWTKYYVQRIANLNEISWPGRLHTYRYRNCYCSIDGVDFKILEPFPFDKKWFSHKFKSAGLRYETVVSTRHGVLVWCQGPFPCGSYPDVKIFNFKLRDKLLDGEKLIADDGYKGACFINKSNLSMEGVKFHSTIRARHETVHKRLRHFGILKQTYRHRLKDHSAYCFAVSNIVCITLDKSSPMFHI